MTALSCTTISGIQWIVAGFAFLAAVFWFLASITKVPHSMDHFIAALQKQSRINAIGAICAAVAAALQAYLIIQPTCLKFSSALFAVV